jgi:DNA polymerase I
MPARNARPVKPGDYVYLIDGSGFIFRAYHALPPLNRRSDGLPLNAVLGFCNMLNKLLREIDAGQRPSHIAVVFDKARQSFRSEIYKDYKANRTDPPSDLVHQFGLIRQGANAFAVPCVEQEGFEADDLIATYARLAREAGAKVRIVSSDKDLMQLVGEGVTLYDTMKEPGREIGEAQVIEKFGVPPAKVIDVQALAGDSIDNVPGVPGIGLKTGAQLILEYGDLEGLLSSVHLIKQPKRREALVAHSDQARLSRELVRLRQDVPLEIPLEGLGLAQPDPKHLIGYFKALEFRDLVRRVAPVLGVDPSAIDAIEVEIAGWSPPEGLAQPVRPLPANRADRPSPPEARPISRPAVKPIDHRLYRTLSEPKAFADWIEEIHEVGHVAIAVKTTSADPMQGDLVGLAMAIAPGSAAYLPFAHRNSAGLDLSGAAVPQLPRGEVLAVLRPLLEDPSVLKIGHDIKSAITVLARYDIAVKAVDDTLLVSYVLDSGRHGHEARELAKLHLGHDMLTPKEILGSGRSAVTFDLVPLDRATAQAAEEAEVSLRLWSLLKPRLAREHRVTVYETLERPLVGVLSGMERSGVLVDRQVLSRLSGELAQKAAALEAEICDLAGGPFNIGSPKQLGDILFGKMQLPGGRKTATGAWSTDSDALETLAEQGVELARKVLDWRQLTKLKSTYADALPDHINPATGRVHTSYALASTSTGRLSSVEPNLQNIPVRTEEGRRIRTAFVAPQGSNLVSADYSQIELRVLAHIADIPQLRRAFAEGLDIHAMTAGEMFGLPVAGMDPLVRRRAKAINFGIIYGISAFGLAAQLGIGRDEAGEYIRTYFRRFPGIRDYIDETKRLARERGYVETIFGRRMHFPRIGSPNPSERAFQERAAINAPIQGSAADIIRRAMTRMPAALAGAGLASRMLMQVHDELVFESSHEEVEATMRLAREVMEKAPEPALRFGVPIQVDVRAARNWEEAH